MKAHNFQPGDLIAVRGGQTLMLCSESPWSSIFGKVGELKTGELAMIISVRESLHGREMLTDLEILTSSGARGWAPGEGVNVVLECERAR